MQKDAKASSEKPENIPPFLKWAGGKRWFVDNWLDLLPENFNTFIEPFVGSGAVFFALKPSKAILGDSNKDLIASYQAIKFNSKLVLKHLKTHSNNHGKRYYYRVRSSAPKTIYARAARLIYLNRTCWNGLYRVNALGNFNVPIGTRRDIIRKNEDFSKIEKLLKNAKLRTSDFEPTINLAKKGDLVFVDPPYTVKHNNNGFIKYNEKIFSWDDQIRLKNCLKKAQERGAYIFVTNACHRPIRNLYKDYFRTKGLIRTSSIAADPSKRGLTEEILIMGKN